MSELIISETCRTATHPFVYLQCGRGMKYEREDDNDENYAAQTNVIRRTRAEGVVCPLELLAGSVILALGGNALEVVGVVLEATCRQNGTGTQRATNLRSEEVS